jgi:hypothetical protein
MKCGKISPKRLIGLCLAVLFIAASIGCAAAKQKLTDARFAPQDAEVVANMKKIQAGLIRYARQYDGVYPASIRNIVDEDFMPSGYPENPFTSAAVKDIRFGEDPFQGEFTYIPVTIDGKIKGYYLIGYGAKETEGRDIDADGKPDHVIEVLQGPEDEAIKAKMPPLADLLKKSG